MIPPEDDMAEDSVDFRAEGGETQFFTLVAESLYPTHIKIYTDGSMSIAGVSSAAVMGDKVRKATLPNHASILSAKFHAVELACRDCRLIEESANPGDRFLLCSGSLSMVLAIQNYGIKNHMLQRLQRRMLLLQVAGLEVVIMWTPGHSGIKGNVLADAVAKWAAVGVPEFICVPYSDWYPIIREHINKEWEEKWNECNQFLYQSKPAIGPHIKSCKFRRDKIVLNSCGTLPHVTSCLLTMFKPSRHLNHHHIILSASN